MKSKIMAVFLVIIMLFSLPSCSKNKKSQSVTDINMQMVKTQDLGTMMPKILFADKGKVVFWGTFGLFVVDGEDGSIYRSVNLERIGYNHMTGEIVTNFLFSENREQIYFYNEDAEGNNVEEFYYRYSIEEDTVRQIPITVDAVVLEQPSFSLDDLAGGEPGQGYSSNPVFYDDNVGVYLHAADWRVKDLELVFYDHTTQEFRRVNIFK